MCEIFLTKLSDGRLGVFSGSLFGGARRASATEPAATTTNPRADRRAAVRAEITRIRAGQPSQKFVERREKVRAAVKAMKPSPRLIS